MLPADHIPQSPSPVTGGFAPWPSSSAHPWRSATALIFVLVVLSLAISIGVNVMRSYSYSTRAEVEESKVKRLHSQPTDSNGNPVKVSS